MSFIIALTVLEFTADLIVEFNPSLSPKGWDTALKVFSRCHSRSRDAEADAVFWSNSESSRTQRQDCVW
jgi:hypothetical protein